MAEPSKDVSYSVVTTLAAILAPFLAAAAALLFGIGIYRIFVAGPVGAGAGWSAGWDIIAPGWPLFLSAALLAGIGVFAFQRVGSRNQNKKARGV